jgi:hypothetical protein
MKETPVRENAYAIGARAPPELQQNRYMQIGAAILRETYARQIGGHCWLRGGVMPAGRHGPPSTTITLAADF